ncbi:hypothetical protein H310_14199 [Aphanomyces invadans]|uniref:Uncharacterized protein n=1 Tax=Aphanomyces invadans TaxID=157072 RepID=A0A024TB14_9STRA|nr:hypothetical protein H310_14199 [Aphanomyces invadans]ETV91199.1 hypothetical protein H310_14199 [Aphanomyces invadans]|eukprot:XP_008880230.1 hypothetical protein H310_14199 [Aphanomyces invadans]
MAAAVDGAAVAAEEAEDFTAGSSNYLMNDVDLGSDYGYGHDQEWNLPAIPQPPNFEGLPYVRENEKYLTPINTLRSAFPSWHGVLDADSRVGRMLGDFMRVLEQDRQE